MSIDSSKIRLRKKEENEILGPMDMDELKILADSAYISPGDEVSFGEGAWIKAVSVEELGMCWTIRSSDGAEYGPTTLGTVREFMAAGEIDKEAILINTRTKKESTARAELGEEIMAKMEAELEAEKKEQASALPDRDLEESLEVAKDLRIRTLEVEQEALKKDYEELSQKYRRAAEELMALKKA
ncbi:MAG: hypothetical protein HC904_03120 [Blastochloris sp.]|nr:hypothetical protein [Blastochloris sp.]